MASSGDCSDNPDKITPTHGRRSSAKKIVYSSDSEEEAYVKKEHKTPVSAESSARRDSLRKRHRSFQLPSREEQWKAIASEPVTNRLSRLTPKKLINDFTRVTHRYNYDHVEVSGEESMEEFIKGSDSPETDSSSDDEEDTKRGHRVKGYRPRIAKLSDSSDEEEDRAANLQDKTEKQSKTLKKQSSTKQNGKKQKSKGNDSEKLPTAFREEGCNNEGSTVCHDEKSDNLASSDEDGGPMTTSKKRRKTALLELDSDDPNHLEHQEDFSEQNSNENRKKQPQQGFLNAQTSQVCSDDEDSLEIKTPKKPKTKSALDSDSDSREKESVCEIQDQKRENTSCGSKGTSADPSDTQHPTGSSRRENISDCSTSKVGKVSKRKSDDSAIIVDSSHSSDDSESDGSSITDDEGSESGDNSQYKGRIQKLAAQKKKRRDSLFGQLRVSRAKRQKKA